MRREKQINESKNMIKEALFALLLEKEFREISISEITARAKVARMTFYRNFDSKVEIVLYLFETILEQIKTEVNKIPSPTIKDLMLIRFKVLRKNPDINQLIAKEVVGELFEEFRKINMKSFKDFLPPVVDAYTLAYKLGGINSVTEKWMKGGMKESPEEMTGKLMGLLK